MVVRAAYWTGVRSYPASSTAAWKTATAICWNRRAKCPGLSSLSITQPSIPRLTSILIISILIKFGQGFFVTGFFGHHDGHVPARKALRQEVFVQFHLNGFEPGDPEISKPAQRQAASGSSGPAPAEVDVLIIGCGPAGLTLAAQLSALPDLKPCSVEQKPGPVPRRQADGIAG